MLKTYNGSCHCGAVRFRVSLDLSAGTNRCNCSYCMKIRNWGALVRPDALELLAGADTLADYQFGSKQGHHRFCRICGVRTFSDGYIEELGGAWVGINVGALDDATDTELAEAPVRHGDGRNDAWGTPPAETRHL